MGLPATASYEYFVGGALSKYALAPVQRSWKRRRESEDTGGLSSPLVSVELLIGDGNKVSNALYRPVLLY